jgi:hypothetical protein
MHLVHVCLCPYHLIAEILFQVSILWNLCFQYKGVYTMLMLVTSRRQTTYHRHLFHSKNICPFLFLTSRYKQLPFTPSPLRLNIFRLFVILSLTQLYRATLNINVGPPSDELDKNIQQKSHFLFFSHWNGYSHFRSILNWFRN